MKSIVKLAVLVIVSVLFTSSLYAQRKAPGYMGKRFLLKYDQGISWSFGGEARGIPNLHYTLQGDVAVSTKFSVGLEYSFMTRKYDKARGTTEYSYYSQPYLYPYYELDRTFMHKVGIYAKLFSQRNGHIAPAGPFLTFGLNVFLLDGRFRRYQTGNYSGSIITDKTFTFDIGPSLGGGKQYIVGNRLVLSLDVRFTLPLLGMARAVNAEMQIGEDGDNFNPRLNRMNLWTAWPNAQANFIVIRMGIGTLL